MGQTAPREQGANHGPYIYLTHTFKGEAVSIDIGDKPVFFGRVISEGASQLAAKLAIDHSTKVFTVKVSVRSQSGNREIVEKIDLSKGSYILVFFVHEQLSISQMTTEPEFF